MGKQLWISGINFPIMNSYEFVFLARISTNTE
jgi:hypothetical protein